MSSNNIENKNIKTYCVSVMVQGVQCPAERRGKQCHMAHTSDEVNPRKCNRGSEGEECRCKHRTYPFVCQFIHEETKEEYSKRVGFDPNHEKYNDYSLVEIKKEMDKCGEVVDELKEKISKFDLNKIPEKDKAYVRRTQNSIHHLSLKIKWFHRDIKEEFLKEKKWEAENREIQEYHAEMDRLDVWGYSERHEDDNGDGDMYFRTPEEKAKNREKVRAKFKKGKYIRVEDVFEDENDEACFEEYVEMMEQDAMHDNMDMEGSFVDMELSIAREWVKCVIERWDREDKGEKFEDRHLKNAWGDYRDDWDQKKATWEDRCDKWEEQLRERDDDSE